MQTVKTMELLKSAVVVTIEKMEKQEFILMKIVSTVWACPNPSHLEIMSLMGL